VYVRMGLPVKKEEKVENTSSTNRANELRIEMFGTPEQVAKMAKNQFLASTRDEAKEILKKIVNKPLASRAGITATLSNNSMGKILSGKAVDKSYNKEAHFLAAANLEHLFSNAIEPFIFPTDPSKHNENYKRIRRLYAPMEYKNMIIPVKFTVFEMLNEREGTRVYSLEAIDFPIGKK